MPRVPAQVAVDIVRALDLGLDINVPVDDPTVVQATIKCLADLVAVSHRAGAEGLSYPDLLTAAEKAADVNAAR